ncbi:MAG TPA: ABC transporter permease [Terriglobales bacterium]|jgi:predicted permease|nr:ABC transporter permease [Terriglobales bacterium]
MTWLKLLLQRLRASFSHPQIDQELDMEMASHLEIAIEENLKQGMSVEEARRQASVRFGGVEQAKQQHREARGFLWLDVLSQDLRYTFRALRRDPGFAAIAILILSFGIGANVAVFSVVNTILLRPLPFRDPQQLVWITGLPGKGGLSSQTYSTDAYKAFLSQQRSFQDVTGYFAFSTSDNTRLMGRGEPLLLSGILVNGNFFQTLGVQPILGRLFRPEECQKNAAPVTLLGYAFWKREFGGDPDIVGKAVNFDGRSVTIVGVVPETFDFGSVFSPGSKIDTYGPAILDDMEDWGNTLALIGRLKPGVSIGQAQAEADLLFPRLLFSFKHPDWGGNYTGKLSILKDYVSGKLRRSLIVLWCAVGLILLIVCVNLSNLMLARAAARGKEFAMRSALGAGRGRLVRQLLTESIVLSAIGALLGLGLACGLTFYLAHQGSIALPLLSSVTLDGSALVWTLLITIATAMIFGLVPGLKMSRSNLQEALKDSGQGLSEGKKHETLRAALVISELSLACVLLVGAGLLLHSFLRVLDVDLGFEPSRTAAIKVDFDDSKPERRGAVLRDMLQRILAVPGIEATGVADNLPLDMNRSWGLSAKGKEYKPGELPATFVYVVTPGYLNVMGIRMLAGRDISWQDETGKERVVIINQTAARYLWPGEDPVGRMALVSGMDTRVIGVVADVRESSAETAPGWQMYLPVMQNGPVGARLVVRTKLSPNVLASSVMATLRSINPAQPATEFRPMQNIVDHSVSPRRFFVSLVGIFAVLGLVLASLGIYGVISYSVTRQTQEIGIRMALGATVANVQLRVIAKTLRLALIGIVLGAVASFAMARAITSLLFAVQPNDPPTFTSTILLLTTVAIVAGYVPARRASRINPMIALRND